jgi:DeoR family transcriptional regulator, aga operon transcriptional repressor
VDVLSVCRREKRVSEPMSSKTEKRAKEILRLLLNHGKATVEELTEEFRTSPASIRRDLVRLEERGLVHRTHGGAMLAGQIYEPFRFDASFQVREERFTQEKQRIAAAAAELVGENETVGFTAGTTTTLVARCLRLRSGLHVITNAVNIGIELTSSEGLDTTLIGGCMRWPGAFSLVGPTALESLNTVVMDRLFLGVTGIDARYGATVIESDEAAVFRAMSRRAKEVIVVADSSKVGMVSPAVVCPLASIDILITDDGIAEEAIDALRRSDVRVVIA